VKDLQRTANTARVSTSAGHSGLARVERCFHTELKMPQSTCRQRKEWPGCAQRGGEIARRTPRPPPVRTIRFQRAHGPPLGRPSSRIERKSRPASATAENAIFGPAPVPRPHEDRTHRRPSLLAFAKDNEPAPPSARRRQFRRLQFSPRCEVAASSIRQRMPASNGSPRPPPPAQTVHRADTGILLPRALATLGLLPGRKNGAGGKSAAPPYLRKLAKRANRTAKQRHASEVAVVGRPLSGQRG